MSRFLTEDGNLFLTETTGAHWLVEPVVTANAITVRFSGTVEIYQLGNGWALDSPGGGIIKSVNPDRLIQLALSGGATSVEIL